MYSEGDYSLIDVDLAGFYLQPGFVEGVIAEQKRFGSLAKAYRHIFRRNLEYAIILWNGLPVRLSYPEDISLMASQIIALLDYVQNPDTHAQQSYELTTPNLYTLWNVKCSFEQVSIEGYWYEIAGNYEAALNQLGSIRMLRDPFLHEWKLLLKQLIKALEDSETVLTTDKSRKEIQKLMEIESRINCWGRFYQYKNSD